MEYIIAIVVYFLFAMLTAYGATYFLVKYDKECIIERNDYLAIIIISLLWIIFVPLTIMISLGTEHGKRKKEESDDNEQ